MLPQKYRLKRNKEFEKAFKKGKTFKKNGLLIKVFKTGLPHSRVGVVAGKKFSNKAVKRNSIKRKIRAAVAEFIKETERPADVIVLAGAETDPQISFWEIKSVLEEVFLETGMVKSKPLKKQ